MLWLGLSLTGIALAVVNLRGTVRICRSGVYERGQLIVQTILLWAVPGTVFAVMHVLTGDRPGRPVPDPTVTNPATANEHITAFRSGAL
jgi:hypothetical protein